MSTEAIGIPRQAAAPDSADRGQRAARLVEALSGRWRLAPVLLTLAIIWAFFAAQSSLFLTGRNLSNLSVQIVVTAVLSLGLVVVLLVGEIDLAVAAASALCGAVAAQVYAAWGWNPIIAVAAAIAAGAVIGLVQGFIATTFNAPAFIVTLGVSLALQGALLELLPASNQVPLTGTPLAKIANTFLPEAWGWVIAIAAAFVVGVLLWQSHRHRTAAVLGSRALTSVWLPTAAVLAVGLVVVAVLNSHRGVPTPVAILLGLLAAMSYVTTQTRFGTYLYAIGGNPEAARRAGIPVRRITIAAFMFCAAMAATGGVIAASRVLGVSPQSGGGTLLLEAVAAAVIGGASLFGGRGSVWAALIGALVIGSLSNGMDLIGVSTQVKLALQGTILVLAVVVDGVLAGGGKTLARRRT